MKRILFSFSVMAVFISCGGNAGSGSKKAGGDNNTPANDLSSNPVYTKGLGLVSKSDCLTCHKVDEAVTGPAYRDVANKYAGMSDTIVTHLAKKIISGGTGNWGSVAMTPHPAISQEDAEAMVKYVLLLKNK